MNERLEKEVRIEQKGTGILHVQVEASEFQIFEYLMPSNTEVPEEEKELSAYHL